MEMYPGTSTQQPAAICALKSPADAIHILEAVRLGLVPRVTRRLTGHERAMIRPGTVWVWEEEETNMRRWTDGRRWGASRVGGGGFLVYTESSDTHSPPSVRSDLSYPSPHGSGFYPEPSSSRRPESLIKQTYSTTMTHPVTGKMKKFHVVAYSSKHNPQGDAHNPFPLPYQLPSLASLKVAPGIWPEWENRREPETFPAQRPSQTPFSLTSQSTPITAMSSPGGGGPLYSTHPPPPTAFPAPPSPRRDPFARPFPPPMDTGLYDPKAAPSLNLARTPSGSPYPSSFQHSGRVHAVDTPSIAYSGRHGSLPPAYAVQPAYGGAERYHPYAPPRSSGPGSRLSYPPPASSASSTPTIAPVLPTTPNDLSLNVDRVGISTNHTYSPYQRPYSSSGDHAPAVRVSTTPENKIKFPSSADSPHTDPRRYPSTSSDANNGHCTQSSGPPRIMGVSTSPTNSMSQLVPPHSSVPSDRRSPKMSIASTLLNQGGMTQGTHLTLPPLRVNLDERDGLGSGPLLPSPGHISPRIPSDGSPTDSLKLKERDGKGWGEDARQLGELGKRVVL